MISDIAIIGAGVAGMSAVQALRSEGYDGRLVLIGEEPQLPYDRTALSKGLLTGEFDEVPLLSPAAWYDEQEVQVVLDRAASRLDLRGREVVLDGDLRIRADRVLLATGAAARRPVVPGADLPGVETLRTAGEAERLRRAWQPGQRLVVVGGGLIGCEIATTAGKAGLEVTILEASDELLQRVLGRRLGGWTRELLQESGVDVRLGTGAAEFIGTDRVTGVLGTDGRLFPADIVIVSIGADPRTELAEQAGLACQRGIVVDDVGTTSSPAVFAVGDAASWPLHAGGRRSLETYLNSQGQAATAAAAMLGNPVPAPQIPLSWTEIAEHHFQMIGDIDGPGEHVLRGALDGGPSLLFRLVDGAVAAAVSVDASRDFAIATRLVGNGTRVDANALADTDLELRQLLRAARTTALAPSA
ncbi:NAD(P)/FAD-dependent oxidoreductase [Raineyella sp. W15-4]|uniref:NAD(P)/FAD-dependent oxidoreductase n=1 Tax=Raineyella sp. W15-4 TaxID=3081651 RepID=UPI002955862B|nr:FAD-dependent oxidoreductase [Raineyella sp. W15-4]WOQ16265.1 FAD-dependent oxidoreductase [Raineyella sp. W15-4]